MSITTPSSVPGVESLAVRGLVRVVRVVRVVRLVLLGSRLVFACVLLLVMSLDTGGCFAEEETSDIRQKSECFSQDRTFFVNL
jgi:hypothetical protein